jgi:N-acetyl-1-D-myo-inositol-2-amino-2-deoxy-alpha-D-glucopyranoside deacetylase
MQPRSLLALFAHPDDEAFGSGGTLAYYAGNNVRVTLVCATRGEVGEISDPALASPDTLGEVREGELRNAAHALGVADLHFLDYRDSGMAGTADNNDPRAFVNAPADIVVGQLVQIIRQVQPRVVITFDPHGGYGHPDHIAIHRHTVTAFHAAGDAAQYPEAGPIWQPARLFYTVIPRSMFHAMRNQLAATGVDTTQLDQFEERGIGWPDEQIHVALDVSATVDAKWRALNAHRTQFGPENLLRRVPADMAQQILSREHFALAWPQAPEGLTLPDLFADL